MEHHRPHKNAAFEGYYSKFDLPSGAHLALVVCQVKAGNKRPNMVSFTYVPRGAGSVYQKEVWPGFMEIVDDPDGPGFRVNIPGMGYVKWNADSSVEYTLDHSDFFLHAKTTSRTSWSDSTNTPEGLLVHLPLPLHWHVQSLASNCEFNLKIDQYELPPADTSGHAVVHDEKNWATSFPSAHMWLQARDGDRGFCCAGGRILGVEAFLLGYRSKDHKLDFRPPFATRLAGISPFMSYETDWTERSFFLSVQSFRQKLIVHAKAPEGSFHQLSAPFPEGHRPNFLGQSFKASLKIQVFESAWLSPWRLVLEDEFENASLEFGGGFYPPAGSDMGSN